MIDLSIALVNWNGKDYLRQCLESIEAAQLPLTVEIIVTDNASNDGSQQMLAERFPYVILVQNERNMGVAQGNNQCIRHSTGRYIYILNTDTIINAQSVLRMVEFLDQHDDVGAVGGQILNPDGTFQGSFAPFPTLWEEFLLVTHLGRRLNPYFPSPKEIPYTAKEVDWLCSASVIVRRSALEQIGLIDEDYFLYSDETDWQYRLWQAGWKIVYLPDVTTIHFGGGSFKPGSGRYTLVYRGRMLFARKHYSTVYGILQRIMFGCAAVGRQALWLALYPFPKWRNRAKDQLASNSKTIRLCLQLE